MPQHLTRQRRTLALLLGAGVIGTLLASHLPHRHPDGASSSDPNHSCALTTIQRGCAPEVPVAAALRVEAVVTARQPQALDVLDTAAASATFASRAPPQRS